MIRRLTINMDGIRGAWKHPGKYDEIPLSQCMRETTTKRHFIPGENKVRDVLCCPRCEHSDRVGEDLHSVILQCESCHLMMQTMGNCMRVWEATQP